MDSFFQRKEVKDVLLSRGKESRNLGSSFSAGDKNGLFTREYISWQVRSARTKVTMHLNDDERVAWFRDNPEPQNKYKKV